MQRKTDKNTKTCWFILPNRQYCSMTLYNETNWQTRKVSHLPISLWRQLPALAANLYMELLNGLSPSLFRFAGERIVFCHSSVLEEEVGFEPTEPCCPTVFKTVPINHSGILPYGWFSGARTQHLAINSRAFYLLN